MSSGLDIHKVGWYGDGNETDGQLEKILVSTPGIVRGENGDVQFTTGTAAPVRTTWLFAPMAR
jgi:hypothetical protein